MTNPNSLQQLKAEILELTSKLAEVSSGREDIISEITKKQKLIDDIFRVSNRVNESDSYSPQLLQE